jgi:hypothetical protein
MRDSIDNGKTSIGRRTLLTTGSVGAAAAVAGVALAQPAAATGRANSGSQTITVDVDTDGFADFQGPATTGSGSFYVSGIIFRRGRGKAIGTRKIGTFHCWGFIRDGDGLTVVNQEFDIDYGHGPGKIQVSGVESDAPRAITGGTGHYANARGEGHPDIEIFDFGDTGRFRIKFKLEHG